MNGPAIHLDGRPVQVLEARDSGGGYCGACGRTGFTALLVGSPEKDANRHWVIAKRINPTSFVTHECKAAV